MDAGNHVPGLANRPDIQPWIVDRPPDVEILTIGTVTTLWNGYFTRAACRHSRIFLDDQVPAQPGVEAVTEESYPFAQQQAGFRIDLPFSARRLVTADYDGIVRNLCCHGDIARLQLGIGNRDFTFDIDVPVLKPDLESRRQVDRGFGNSHGLEIFALDANRGRPAQRGVELARTL